MFLRLKWYVRYDAGVLLLKGKLYPHELPTRGLQCPCIIACEFIAPLDLIKRQEIINDVQHVRDEWQK